MDQYDEAQIAFEAGLQFDPENAALKSGVSIAERAMKMEQVIPRGILVPVPIVFDKENPHSILWNMFVCNILL